MQLALSIAAAMIGLYASHTHWTPLLTIAVGVAVFAVAVEAAAQRSEDRLPAAAIDRWLARSTSAGVAAGLMGGPFTLARLGGGALWPLAFVVLGACLRASAIATLGGDFTSDGEAPEALTTSGLYARLRHPSELGLLLLSGGFALAAPSALVVTGLVTVAVTSALRIRREDRALSRRFGSAYRAYARRVPALLPSRAASTGR